MSRVLLVGGSGGVGTELYEYFLSDYKEKPGQVYSLSSQDMDVTDITRIRSVINMTRPSIVIYLSVISNNSFVHKITPESLKEQLAVNVEGLVNTLSCSLELMRKEKYGRFIYISSVLSRRTVMGTSIYSASKSFGERLIQIAALENASKGITCNTVRLGYFDVGLINTVPEDHLHKIIEEIPQRRLGTIKELYSVLTTVIRTEYINGATVDITGGL